MTLFESKFGYYKMNDLCKLMDNYVEQLYSAGVENYCIPLAL